MTGLYEKKKHLKPTFLSVIFFVSEEKLDFDLVQVGQGYIRKIE